MSEISISEYMKYKTRAGKAELKVTRLRGLLRKVEWVESTGEEYYEYCPECKQTKQQGHADDCELAEELRDA